MAPCVPANKRGAAPTGRRSQLPVFIATVVFDQAARQHQHLGVIHRAGEHGIARSQALQADLLGIGREQRADRALALLLPVGWIVGVDAHAAASPGGICHSLTKISAPSWLEGAWLEPGGLRMYQNKTQRHQQTKPEQGITLRIHP